MYVTCPWRILKLRRDRHLEQTAATVSPSVVVKDGLGGRRLARSFSRSAATERLVNAIFVVITSELFQLSPPGRLRSRLARGQETPAVSFRSAVPRTDRTPVRTGT